MVVALAVARMARGQELEPRVYLPSPVGSNLIVVGASGSVGDVIFDPTLPVEDANARVRGVVVGYYRSFGLLGRTASVGGTLPLLWGSAEGRLEGVARRVERRGLADMSLRLTLNILGSPAMDIGTLVARGRRVNLGGSILVVAPTGSYDSTRVVNIGANRWAAKPQLGLSIPVGERWLFDVYAGVWLFAENPDQRRQVREQTPLGTTEAHLSFNLSRRAWVAFNATYYRGGAIIVDDVERPGRQKNLRLGGTVSLPLANRQALRFSSATGVLVRLGADFTSWTVAWSYAWGAGL